MKDASFGNWALSSSHKLSSGNKSCCLSHMGLTLGESVVFKGAAWPCGIKGRNERR